MTDAITEPTEWDTLEPLRRDAKLGPASKLAFQWLWHHAGAKPAHLLVTTKMLGFELGRTPQAAQKWLDQLIKAGLIEIVDRDQRGMINLYIFHPHPGSARNRPDPQRLLPLEPPPPPANLSPPKGSHLSTPKGENLSTPKGSRPTHQTPEKPAIPPPATNLSAAKGVHLSPRPIGTNEEDIFNLPKYQGTTRSKDTIGTIEDPTHIGLVLAEALSKFTEATHPLEQKRRLVQDIKRIVNTRLADWVAGATADLIVFHEVPLRDLQHILQDVCVMRQAGNLRSASGFFHRKAEDLADRYAAPWPKKRKGTQRTK